MFDTDLNIMCNEAVGINKEIEMTNLKEVLAESRDSAIAEAIENADAYLNNVAIPSYSELVSSLVVKVEVRNVYGNATIYPANAAAERFAAIAGKKTLSNADLMNIQALGFKVEEVFVKKIAA